MGKRTYTFTFGPFQLEEPERTLQRGGVGISLTPKTFDLLLVLLKNNNSLVEKGRLLSAVWGDVHVDDAVLTRAISDLRKALGQTEEQVWIETVPKFGYRFAGAVHVDGGAEVASAGKRWPRWGWAAAMAVAASLVAALVGWGTIPSGQSVHELVVLPFQPLGGSPSAETLGVGLADALITRLSNLQGLIVRPLSAVRGFAHGPIDSLQAAQELHADAVLEGTLQFSDGSVRADIRLIRAKDGQALWAETVESRTDRLFALEDSLAEQVALKLAVRLNPEERRQLALHPELNPEAHRLYVDGRYEWGKRSLDGFEKGAEYFRQAIDRDPTYGRAYAGLADCYLLLGLSGDAAPLEMLPKAKTTAMRALELDPHLAEAHATLGLITQNLDWNWKDVEAQYRESIRLAPNYSTAHHWYAEFLSIQGRFDESRREFERAREIDPISPIIQADEAQLYFFERQYDRNLELLRKVARDDPSFAVARERLALTYLMQGRDEDAWREAMSLPECADEAGDCRRTWTAWLPRRDPRAARGALAQLDADASAGRIPEYTVLFGDIRQGQLNRALDWLEHMVNTHGVWLITAKVHPMFEPLRSQPRGRAVLARLHLE